MAAVTCLLLTGAACSSSAPAPTTSSPGTSSAPASNAALCADLQAVRADVDKLRSINPNTATPAEVQAIVQDAAANLTKAAHDASGAASAKITAVQTAFNALIAAFSALPTSISGSQAFAQVQPQLIALIAALDAAAVGTDCPSASVSMTASP